MDSHYYPPLPISLQADDEIKKFIAEFYRVSDNSQRNNDWLAFFHDDGQFTLADNTAQGHSALQKMRQRMWEAVGHRKHTLYQAFPGKFDGSGDSQLDLMIVGKVEFVMGTGDKKEADWAGHMKLRKDDGGKLRISRYRVYITPARSSTS